MDSRGNAEFGNESEDAIDEDLLDFHFIAERTPLRNTLLCFFDCLRILLHFMHLQKLIVFFFDCSQTKSFCWTSWTKTTPT